MSRTYFALTSGRYTHVMRESGTGLDRTTAIVETFTGLGAWDRAADLARQLNRAAAERSAA